MKIKDLERVELPREKLAKYGSDKLKNYELLAIVLSSGIEGLNVLELSKKILELYEKQRHNLTLQDLLKIKGLGPAKAGQVFAALELGKRWSKEPGPEILTPEHVWNFCADIRASKREHFVAFYLDTQNQVIDRQIISIGTLNASLVHPREVFEPALTLRAASVIIAHNHPSGDLDPSSEDREVTKRLADAGRLLGVELTDHIIVSKSGQFSFTQAKLL